MDDDAARFDSELSNVISWAMNRERRVAELEGELESAGAETPTVDIVFDGPPGQESGRFVEVEDEGGVSISYGEWGERLDGMWALRIVTNWHTFQDATRRRALQESPRP